MRTRSQARKRRQQQVQQTSVESSILEKLDNPPIVTMAELVLGAILEAPHRRDLSLSELTPTCMTLELADRSITTPIGIAKDVRVLVGKFQFPADFVVVEFETRNRVPSNFRRCFLKTSRALIDVYEVLIQLTEVDPTYYDTDGDILILDSILCNNEPPTPIPNQEDRSPETQEKIKLCEPQTDDNKLPVIIAKELSLGEKADLIKVLKSHKRAIAWKLSDIQVTKAMIAPMGFSSPEFDFKVLDTKGAENLGEPIILSRRKPYENVLDPKEINETFPLRR
ncbi:hypothetical protein Tco_0765308 [Tanacetum coccineum]